MKLKSNRYSVAACVLLPLFLIACASQPQKPKHGGDYAHFLQQDTSPVDAKKLGLEQFKTADEARGQAMEALQRGNADQALFYFVKAAELDPKDAKNFVSIGDLHSARSNTVLAANAYQLALNAAGDDVAVREKLGLSLLKLSQYSDAQKHLHQVIAADNGRYRAYNGLGVIADIQGDLAAANTYFGQAIKLAPQSTTVLNNYAYSLYLGGSWDKAEQFYRKALAIDPKHGQAALNYGLLLARKSQAKEAFNAFRRVLTDAQAYNEIGYIYMMEQRYDEATHLFKKAIAASPMYFAKAYENLEQVRALKPDVVPIPDSMKQSVLHVDQLPAPPPAVQNSILDSPGESKQAANANFTPDAVVATGNATEVAKRYSIDE